MTLYSAVGTVAPPSVSVDAAVNPDP